MLACRKSDDEDITEMEFGEIWHFIGKKRKLWTIRAFHVFLWAKIVILRNRESC